MNKHKQHNHQPTIQQPTQKQNYRHSQTSSKDINQGLRSSESILLSRNTFNFEEINAKTGQKSTQRIHGKMGTKRMGGKVVLVGKKQKMECKEANVSKNGRKQKLHVQFDCRDADDKQDNMTSGMSIKSYEFEQKTDNNEPKDNEDRSSMSSKQQERNSLMTNPPTPKYRQEQEMFKQLKRKMMAENELFKNKKQQQNCFYATLKRKLKMQMMKIQEKQDYDRINFTIQGCNANIHAKTNQRLMSENKRQRPQTALNASKVDAYKLNSKSRPLSEREKSYRSLERSITVNDLINKTVDILNHKGSERQIPKQKLSHPRNPCHQQSLTKRKRHSRNQSQDSYKMNKILDNCADYSQQQQIMKDNLKIFQFYCKKMDARFQRVSHQLDLVQNFQIE